MTEANPINIREIDHVVLRVKDMQRMLDFYRAVLGCKLERGPGELGLAQLRAGSSLIDLLDCDSAMGRAGGGEPSPDSANMDHFCLQLVPWDEDEILGHLRRHGVEHEEIARRYGAGGHNPSIYLRDPEGNRVELTAGRG